jgi:hypothetical protein
VLGAVVGLVIPYVGKIKTAPTADPITKPTQRAPAQGLPAQKAAPPQSPNTQPPAPPAANGKGLTP